MDEGITWALQRAQALLLLLKASQGDIGVALRAEAWVWRTHAEDDARNFGDCAHYCTRAQHALRRLTAAKREPTKGEKEEEGVPRPRAADPATRTRLLTFVSMADVMSEEAQRALRCPKCNDFLVSFTKQRRSADEAPNAITTCPSCSYRTEVRG